MKKILFGMTALSSFLLSFSSVYAAPVKLSVGGYSKFYTGFVDGNDEFDAAYSYNHVPVVYYLELAFRGETILENGLKLGATIEIEAVNRDPSDIDKQQSFVYADTSMGRFAIGKMDTLSQTFHTASKDVGIIESQSSDVGMLVPGGMDYVATDIRQNGVSATTISYVSPKLGGFTFGASYSDMADDATHNNEGNDAAYMGLIAFDHRFGDFRLSADVSYARFDSYYPADDIISAGIRAEYNGFTFGGGYKHENFIIRMHGDVNTYDVGVAYETGPYGVSVMYINETTDGVMNTRDSVKQMVLGSVAYGISPGIKSSLSAAYINDKNYSHNYDEYMLAAGLLVAF